MAQNETLTLEEAAELLGISQFELKVLRQRGMKPGSLGRLEAGRLVFSRSELLGEPRTSSSSSSTEPAEEPAGEALGAFPEHAGAGWYVLSDGSRVRGKDAAAKAQAKLEG